MDLRLHDVHSCHGFCDGVLDLKAGVGLDEEKGVSLVGCLNADEKLEGSEVRVVDALGEA